MANNKTNKGTELVQLADQEYQKTPVSFVESVAGSLNLPQVRIFFNIIDVAKEKIGKYYERREKGQVVADTLFDVEDFDPDNRDVKTFDIKLADLTEHACDYGDVRKACFALENILVHVTRNIHGQEMETNIQLCNVWTPKSKRVGYISIQFRKEILDEIMNLRKGYIKSLKNLADVVRRDRTASVYMYLNEHFRTQNEFDVPYKVLRNDLKIEGKRQEVVDGKKVVVDYCLYKQYRDFKKRVLADTKEDMDNLLRAGQMEFSFEFEEIRKNNLKKGEPIAIRFRIVTEKKLHEIEEAEKQIKAASINDTWKKLATLACKEHKKWWDVYGACCSVSADEEKLTIEAPSTFVMEQWNKELEWLLPIIKKIFNVDKFVYKIK